MKVDRERLHKRLYRFSIQNIPLDRVFTELFWLRVLDSGWACARTKNGVGNNGILTLFIAVRLFSSHYALFELFGLLFHVNHRNQGFLCGLGLIKSVFARRGWMMDAGVLEKQRHVHRRSC